MKKNIAALFFICFCIFSCSKQEEMQLVLANINLSNQAEQNVVSKQVAVNVASLFFLDSPDGKRTRSERIIKSVESINDSEGQPLAYVVNYEGGGWAIVSATKKYYPILAHAEEGQFAQSPLNRSEGLHNWIKEVSQAIEFSENQEPQTASAIALEWLKYEPAVATLSLPVLPGGNSPEALLCRTRLKQLNDTYYQDGWVFSTLSSQSNNIYFNKPRSIADQCGSPYEYTVVGIRDLSETVQTGPLLITQWNQTYPYNVLCPNQYPAGCVAIAMAQIMNFYKYPAVFDWNNIPNAGATSATQFLIADIGRAVGMEYGPNGSSSNIEKTENGFESYGYSAIQVNHDYNTVKSVILQNRAPVYMRGEGSDGHAWVCDGVLHRLDEYEYYVEYLYNGAYDNLGETLIDLPERVTLNYNYYRYHMNWGWGGTSDGWYYEATPTNGMNFENKRKNIYVYPQ